MWKCRIFSNLAVYHHTWQPGCALRRFPVHCAVLGANVETLKWLVDKHGCPISINKDSRTGRLQSVQTSAGRSLVDLAMTGKPKLAVLRYLVMEKNLSVMDTKDPSLAPRTLEALLRAGVSRESAEASVTGEVAVHVIDDHTEHSGSMTLDDAVRKWLCQSCVVHLG